MLKISDEDIEIVKEIINDPGFRIIEKALVEELDEKNKITRITDDSFSNGKLLGAVEEISLVLYFLDKTRKELKL